MGAQLRSPLRGFSSIKQYMVSRGASIAPPSCRQNISNLLDDNHHIWQHPLDLFVLKLSFARRKAPRIFYFFIDRFKLSSHYISWKLFWQVSYRKDTLLKGVPKTCSKRRESNSYHMKAVQSWKPSTLTTRLLAGESQPILSRLSIQLLKKLIHFL